MASPAKPSWAVEPAAHVEAMLVLGEPPGNLHFRLDLPGKAAYKLGRMAETADIHIQVCSLSLSLIHVHTHAHTHTHTCREA